jgi:hypothetical protein
MTNSQDSITGTENISVGETGVNLISINNYKIYKPRRGRRTV